MTVFERDSELFRLVRPPRLRSVEDGERHASYLAHVHIPRLAALTAMGAGISLAIEQAQAERLDAGARWALAGGAAVYLVSVTVAQRTMVLGFLPRTAQARTVAGK